MIVIKITDRVKPTPQVTYPATKWTGPGQHTHVPAVTCDLFKEITRRDKIMKDLAKGFRHAVGAKVKPAQPEAEKKWGECTILGICTEYVHLERDFKWPKNDNPMIVTAASETGEVFYATTNYFL